METIDVVKKLVGSIHPVGEHNIDTERAKNLDAMMALIDDLMYEVERVVADNRNAYFWSQKNAGRIAKEFLQKYGVSVE